MGGGGFDGGERWVEEVGVDGGFGEGFSHERGGRGFEGEAEVEEGVDHAGEEAGEHVFCDGRAGEEVLVDDIWDPFVLDLGCEEIEEVGIVLFVGQA